MNIQSLNNRIMRLQQDYRALLQTNTPDAPGTVCIDTSTLDEQDMRELKMLVTSVDARGVAVIAPRELSNEHLQKLKEFALRLKARQEQQ